MVTLQKIDNEICIGLFFNAYSISKFVLQFSNLYTYIVNDTIFYLSELKITYEPVILCQSDSTKSIKPFSKLLLISTLFKLFIINYNLLSSIRTHIPIQKMRKSFFWKEKYDEIMCNIIYFY
jgi:hypothetical protein